MLFTTPEQFVVLAIVLIGGWLIGYASAPSAKKLKRRVREQSDSFTAYYADAENKLRVAGEQHAELRTQVARLSGDHAAAERTIAGLRAAAVAPAPAPVVARAVEPAERPAVALPVPAPIDPPPAAEPLVAHDPQPEPVVMHPTPAPAEHAIVPETRAEPVSTDPAEVEAHDHAVAADMWHPAEPEVAEQLPAAPPAPTIAEDRSFAAAEAEGGSAAAGDTLPVPANPAPPAEDVASPPAPPAAPAAALTMPEPAASGPAPIGPAEPAMPSKGWFASSARDDLTRLRGLDGKLDTRLFGLGVTRFEDIENLSAQDEMALEQRLSLPVGYVGREQWRTQASLLRAGKVAEHAAHFGDVTA